MGRVFRAILIVVTAFSTAHPLLAQKTTGRLVGTVIDEFNAMTLPTAPVEVVETGELVYTDMDGKFYLDLPPGSYRLKVTFGGYGEQIVSVNVVAGRTDTMRVSMTMERFTEEVLVTAEAETPELFTAEAQLVERKRAVAITDNLAAEDMRANSDGDAAQAMSRVTGVSVVDGRYVFVRGLGERYSTTQLNGAVIPTTEPDKKVVPLDLFPSGLIQSIQVQKSYMPDRPGDFTGGLVDIEPLNFPDKQIFDFSLGYGFNQVTTGDNFGTYPGGSRDWLGFDDGTRALPGAIPTDARVVRGNAFTEGGFTPEELQTFGRSFADTWEPRGLGAFRPSEAATGAPNQSYSLVWGNSTEKLGAVFSFSYNHTSQNQTEEQNFYKVSDQAVAIQNDYDFNISTTSTTMGMVGNLAYKIDGNNRLAFENFYTNNSVNETRFFEGFNQDIATDIQDYRLFWAEEGIYSGKVSGEHYLANLSNSRIDWKTTFSRATRDEPDLRETLYEYNPAVDEFVLADESQSGFRMFNGLDDNIYELGLDWSFYGTQWSGLPTMFKVGPYYQHRERDFSSRRFRFRPVATGRIDTSQPPETLFATENIGPFFELREETRPTDAYIADQDITAAYGMVDLPLSERWRLIGGVRVERSNQTVITSDPFAIDTTGSITSNLDNTDVLPGLNVVHALAPSQNLRFGYSQTVNRPEFRELAPFEFTDVVGGRAVVGNPDLVRATIQNVDARWEWFPGAGEVIAASFFFKNFTDPIERTVEATAQLRTSFTNAEGAQNTGFELELRKQVVPNLFASVNYTYVNSNIEIGRGAGEVQTSMDRPLAGQSPNVFNGTLDYQVPSWDFSFRVLYNWFDDRIVDVGSLGLPDIIENDRGILDLVAIKRFRIGDRDRGAQLRVAFDNLTDADYLYTQGGELQRLFRLGRTLTVSFSYSLY